MILGDDPGPFAPIGEWERYVKELEALKQHKGDPRGQIGREIARAKHLIQTRQSERKEWVAHGPRD